MLSLHALKNAPGARHRKLRVGCGQGSGRGKTCCRGHKGQYARSGHKHKPGFEGGQMRLIRRIPKRGFNQGRKKMYALVQVSRLDRFEEGSEVTPSVLRNSGLVKGNLEIKILGGGELKKKLVVKAHAFSQSAQRQIAEVGGACKIIA